MVPELSFNLDLEGYKVTCFLQEKRVTLSLKLIYRSEIYLHLKKLEPLEARFFYTLNYDVMFIQSVK